MSNDQLIECKEDCAQILVVEDDPDFRGVLVQTLRKAGYETYEAENGRQAQAMVDDHPVKLVICDIIMPEADGLEVLLDIRKNHPEIKFIAMSGGGKYGKSGDYLEIAHILGAVKCLKKPFDFNELLTALKEIEAVN